MVSGAVLFLAMLLLGWAVSGGVPVIDAAVQHVARGQVHTPLGSGAKAWLSVFNPVLPWVVFGVLAVVLLWALWRGRRHLAVLVAKAIVVLGTSAADVLFKYVFLRPLPFRLPPGVHRYAYPSGHTTAVAAVAVTAVVLTAWLAHRWWRHVALIAAALVAVTATSLVLIGVHYFTDVLGAALGTTGIGLLVAGALGLVPSGQRPGQQPPKPVATPGAVRSDSPRNLEDRISREI